MFNKYNRSTKRREQVTFNKDETQHQPVLVSDNSMANHDNDLIVSSSTHSSGKLGKFGRLFTRKKTKTNVTNSLAVAANKQISEKLNEEELSAKNTLHILLLGAGGSGKTTVFKQMERLFHGYIDEKEMEYALDDIRESVIMDVIDLCKCNIKLTANNTEDDKYKLSVQELQEVCFRIASTIDVPNLNNSLANEMKKLWNDDAFKLTWQYRKKSHIMDNTPYFLDKILEIQKNDYVVTFDDYVRVRDQTAGVIHKRFLVDTDYGRYIFNVTDVGGQRSERRKWMKLFDNVNVVMYIMNLSGYDQVLYEDNTKNCLNESLELFSKTSHEKSFDRTTWFVFFNKIDLFKEKIRKIPFTVYKSDFNKNDENDSDKVQQYIQQQFKNRFYENLPKERKQVRGNLFFHTTCATEYGQVGSIIKQVQLGIITMNVKKMGYIM